MKTWIRYCVLALMATSWTSIACARGELTLKIPTGSPPASLLNKKVYLQTVTDKRVFQDHPRDANIPSLAAGLEKTPIETRSHAVARVRDGNGKGRNNLFTVTAQPVETVVRGVVQAALIQQGYTVVQTEAEVDAETTPLAVEITEFWGYIKVIAGGWAGGMPTMEGEIEIKISALGGDNVPAPLVVSAKVSHKFGLMTAKHWVLMFTELTGAYLAKFPAGKI